MLQCCTAVRNLSAQVDFLCPFFDAASTTLSFSRNFVATNNIFQYGQTMYHPLWLYGLGELLVKITGVSLPGSIVGMLLLAAFLEMGWIKLEWVKQISDFLLSNLGFFFVPPGVALMLNFGTIAKDFWAIAIATLISTILVLLSTGWTHQIVRKYAKFRR